MQYLRWSGEGYCCENGEEVTLRTFYAHWC